MDLKPDTVYRVQVAAATESIVSRGEFFTGPYSPVQQTRTLGQLALLVFSNLPARVEDILIKVVRLPHPGSSCREVHSVR